MFELSRPHITLPVIIKLFKKTRQSKSYLHKEIRFYNSSIWFLIVVKKRHFIPILPHVSKSIRILHLKCGLEDTKPTPASWILAGGLCQSSCETMDRFIRTTIKSGPPMAYASQQQNY
jgi:hypothetical protein